MITPHILPRNSPGVTPNLPRMVEPYMMPLPPKKSIDMPPPAFGQAPSSVTQATPMPVAPVAQPATDNNAAAAAATLRGLTPSRPATYVPGANELPATQTVGAVTATSATPTVAKSHESTATPAAKAAKKPSRKDELIAEEAAARQQAKQAEIDHRNAKIEQERQAKAAKEQARRDAEQAKKDAEAARLAQIEAKKQAENDRIQQRAVDEAAARAKAAEAKYQELLKQKTQSR
jgi:hypothetical protein